MSFEADPSPGGLTGVELDLRSYAGAGLVLGNSRVGGALDIVAWLFAEPVNP
jgi:hypothetical protein